MGLHSVRELATIRPSEAVLALRAKLGRRFVTVEEVVTIADAETRIVRPRSAEDLISEEDFARDDRLPYWADIWPSSVILAEWLFSRAIKPTSAIELGCGVGLVTIAAMLAGHDVLATDYYDDALAFTRLNALLNTGRKPRVLHLDWREPPAELPRARLVLASDVLYERPYAAAVAELIPRLLERNGRAIIADPGRVAVGDFLNECETRGLVLRDSTPHEFRSGEVRQTVTLYTLAPSASRRRAFTPSPQR